MDNKIQQSLVPALEKGLDILEFMASASDPQTLTQLARRVGRSVSEIQRMVACLLQRAYLVRDSLGAFHLSSKLFRLAHLRPFHRDLLARAMPAMETFANQTGESVHASILAEDHLLLIGQVEGRGPVRLTLQIGLSQDPLHTVSGRIHLSEWASRELVSWMKRRRLSPNKRAKLLTRLALIRKHGYDASQSETVEGVHDVAVPVILPGPRIIATLATAWLQPRSQPFKQAMLLKHIRMAARQIATSYEPDAGGKSG